MSIPCQIHSNTFTDMAGQDNGGPFRPNRDVSTTSSIGNMLGDNADNEQRERAQPHSQDANQHEPGGADLLTILRMRTDSTLHIPLRLLNNLDKRCRV
jgi:hypothetical protein